MLGSTVVRRLKVFGSKSSASVPPDLAILSGEASSRSAAAKRDLVLKALGALAVAQRHIRVAPAALPE